MPNYNKEEREMINNVSEILPIFDTVVDNGIGFSSQIGIIRHYIEEGMIVFDSDDNHEWRAKIDQRVFSDLAKINVADSVLVGVIRELNKKH